MPETRRRREMIRELISRNEVRTQEQLRALLEAEGIDTTQSTLSRDLHELGVIKRPEGYELPEALLDAGPVRKALQRVLREAVLNADRGHNLVVLRTETGREHDVLEAINKSRLAEVLGVIAGPGTVWIASRTVTHARGLLEHIQTMMRG